MPSRLARRIGKLTALLRTPPLTHRPVRRYLPDLIDLIGKETIDPGKVFDVTRPLEHVAEGYRAMDERRAIKTLLTV